MLRLLIKKGLLPFIVDIKDNNDQKLLTISRGWTVFMSKVKINDNKGQAIGSITQKFKLFKPTFEIYDRSDKLIATIGGNWKAWDFKINDHQGKQIGIITKKWAGALQEVFTSADKYNLAFEPTFYRFISQSKHFCRYRYHRYGFEKWKITFLNSLLLFCI